MNNEILKLAEECGAYQVIADEFYECRKDEIVFETPEELQAFYDRAFQAGRDSMQLEMSQQKPDGYIYPALYGSRASLCKNNKPVGWDDSDDEIEWFEKLLIIRPQPPQIKEAGSSDKSNGKDFRDYIHPAD